MKKILILVLFLMVPLVCFSQTLTLSGSSINLEIVSLADSVAVLTDFISATGDTLTDVHENLTARAKSAADSIQAGHVALTARTKTLSDSVTAGHTALTAREKTISDSLTAVHAKIETRTNGVKDSVQATHSQLMVTDATLNIVQNHHHSDETWYSKKAVQTATSKADTSGFYAFTLTAAADSTLGTPVQLLGTADTPIRAGNTFFDFHRLFVTGVNSDTPYRVRIIWGATFAAGMTAGTFTDLFISSDTTNPQQATSIPFDIQATRIPAGTEVWAQCANAAGAQTINIMFGIHEYLK